jgi:hypothetical protein
MPLLTDKGRLRLRSRKTGENDSPGGFAMSDKPKDELDDGLRAMHELGRQRVEPIGGDALSILGNAASKLYRATSETAPYTKSVYSGAVLQRDSDGGTEVRNETVVQEPAPETKNVTEGTSLPRTWREAVPYVVWVVFILGFGLEAVTALVHGEWLHFIVSLVGVVLLMAAAIHWKQIKWRATNPNWIWASFAIVLIGLILLPYIEQRRLPFSWQFEQPTRSSVMASGERIIVPPNVTPAYLMGLYEHVSLSSQGDKLLEPFVGTWMHVTEAVADIKANAIWIFLKQDNGAERDVILSFDPEWANRLSLLTKGQNISALCQITSFAAVNALRLEHCQLDNK